MQAQRNRVQNQQIRLNPNDMLGSLTKYSGAVDEDFLGFVRKFNEVTRAMRTPNDQKANLLPLFLDEYAHSTYESLAPQIHENYDRTIAELTHKFVRPEHYTTGLLMSRIQHPKESISSYAHALRTLGSQCCPDMALDTLDSLLQGIFMNGIHQKYKIPLALVNLRTFDDAITAIQKIDLASGGGLSVVHTGLASATIEQPTQMDILRNEIDALRQEMQERESTQMNALIEEVSTLRKERRAKNESSVAICSQQSIFQATQLSPQISPQSTQNPQFNPQFDSYQQQAAPLPPNPYYPQ